MVIQEQAPQRLVGRWEEIVWGLISATEFFGW
jgi:hypothetical protein